MERPAEKYFIPFSPNNQVIARTKIRYPIRVHGFNGVHFINLLAMSILSAYCIDT
ncbi:hypothetical protein NBG4_640011 [Candidatus Sulfobium mesophilum]|uniref:Uncharacterized protein n=1 Tax=Candidatus Sulfobium mesophilum TaxID=2016548 RepID=A0A2U3QJT6_9BACT|nr:hypothetical protein NBG4_640011 [Candidatus Sulfobium mesophilum]